MAQPVWSVVDAGCGGGTTDHSTGVDGPKRLDYWFSGVYGGCAEVVGEDDRANVCQCGFGKCDDARLWSPAANGEDRVEKENIDCLFGDRLLVAVCIWVCGERVSIYLGNACICGGVCAGGAGNPGDCVGEDQEGGPG